MNRTKTKKKCLKEVKKKRKRSFQSNLDGEALGSPTFAYSPSESYISRFNKNVS